MNVKFYKGNSKLFKRSSRQSKVSLFGWFGIITLIATIAVVVLSSNVIDRAIPPQRVVLQTSAAGYLRVFQRQKKQWEHKYQPSKLEAYVIKNGRTDKRLGYDQEMKPMEGSRLPNLKKPENTKEMPSGCELWTDPNVSNNDIYQAFQKYRLELKEYERRLADWKWNYGDNGKTKDNKHDLRHFLDERNNNAVCESLEVHPDGLRGIFASEASLSQLPYDSFSKRKGGGFVEPFLPPLRHPEFCFGESLYGTNRTQIYTKGYLIHDFAALCQKISSNKHGRTVFVDLGAALDFHGTITTPTIELLQLYQRFGFVFDHIYAYELAPKDPSLVYDAIPDDFRAAYHWYNVGVESNRTSSHNPLRMIADTFTPDDFIVVKLDIDTAWIEIPLAKQLLEDPELADLVDVFYFEHHVTMKEIASSWKHSMVGSMQDSLEFFTKFREDGIAAHYWI